MPEWIRFTESGDPDLHIREPNAAGNYIYLDVNEAETLLEVLLDICPNAKALAHNWLLEVQKAEYMKGGK